MSQTSKFLPFAFPPIAACCSIFFDLFAVYFARELLILNGLMIRMNSLCMTLVLLSTRYRLVAAVLFRLFAASVARAPPLMAFDIICEHSY